ncbi:MAG: hypothetical protein HY717_24455 [Planctomycetes bacterium]|nr:hypothetical protein [Planctomycetota bacterium]
MINDFVTNPVEFAKANEKARLSYLQSLTPESAAEDLEAILNLEPEILEASEELQLPPLPPKPLPGPTLAILLSGKPADDFDQSFIDAILEKIGN